MTAKYRKALHRRIRYLKFGGPYMAEGLYYMDHHYRLRYSNQIMRFFFTTKFSWPGRYNEIVKNLKKHTRFTMERRAALTAYPPLPGRVRK